jgi:Calpain family cysteine protease
MATIRDTKPDFKSIIQDPTNKLHLGIGNYAKISKTVVGCKEIWKNVKSWIENYTEECDEKYKDAGWEGSNGLGESVGRGISNFLEMYKGLDDEEEEEKPDPKIVLKSLRELNGGQQARLFGELRIKN